MAKPPQIGVLALQGAFQAHADVLRALGVTPILVRQPAHLCTIDALVMPGGESSTFLRHLERDGFFSALRSFVDVNPTFGTCAGAILLARSVSNPDQGSLQAMDIDIERNSYGRQLDSAIVRAQTEVPGGPLEMVFIRAPRITRSGPEVEVLARRDDDPVLVRQGRLLAATFHPELSADARVHKLFLNMVESHRTQAVERCPSC